jgi:hypothetical protein
MYLLYYADMSESKCNKVFILGAGCSADYGYPLGLKLVEELRKFHDKIRGQFPLIQEAVNKSIELASKFPEAKTLDDLVNRCEERYKNKPDTEQEKLTDEEILSAKIATTALFLDNETEARGKNLEGYKKFLLPAVFGLDPPYWQTAINDSDCSVFTFNYDRLFEIAFLDYFKNSQGPFEIRQFAFYGHSVLNSGFDRTLERRGKRIDIKRGRFCFLKLHGSADWWARKCPRPPQPPKEEWRDYCAKSPQVPTDLADIERCLAGNKQPDKWEPLIAFPHEKQLFTSNQPVDFIQTPYIHRVWKHAAEVIRNASEVTVIGYSFAQIDRPHMLDYLLRKTPNTATIKIVNMDIKAVRRVLESYQDLQDRLKFIKKCF